MTKFINIQNVDLLYIAFCLLLKIIDTKLLKKIKPQKVQQQVKELKDKDNLMDSSLQGSRGEEFISIRKPNKKNGQVYVTFKVNGSLQKIRKIYAYELAKEIEDFLYFFTKEQQNLETKTKNNININIKPIISDLASEDCFQTFQQIRNLQNYQLLKAQISLFSSQEEIFSFIQTQKTLAHNQQEELTALLFNSLKIAQQLTKFHEINEVKSINLAKFSQQVYTKEKLQEMQDNCLKVLERVKQQRRKSQLCSICWHKNSNTILIPCMHLVSCQNCSQMIERCPICKAIITKKSLVYR